MHELSVCQGLLDQVARVAAAHGAAGVKNIVLRIGPLSGVVPSLLAQAFPLARAGTVATDAALTIEELPVRVRCDACGAETEARPNRLLCGECGDWRTQLIGGDELLLARVELTT
jgi:hydrogenase nickel incorporation protein HypA/HybF